MPVTQIDVTQFNELRLSMPVLDVRSPGEYMHAHIPGALSFPLFSDEERKVIGTAYKQQGREPAILIGLGSFGGKLVSFVQRAGEICGTKRDVIVHCWRGGMRSSAVAWLLGFYGFNVHVITGGYKAWRKWALGVNEDPPELKLLGGHTGSNKTGLIRALMNAGEAAIDLEDLARHRGSAFGNLDFQPQPSQEHFENLLALEIVRAQRSGHAVWVEAESQRIGLINIPIIFFRKMQSSPYYFVDIPFEERLKYTVKEYGVFRKEAIINAIVRIKKRIGGIEAKEAITKLMDDDLEGSFSVLLKYYDRVYLKAVRQRSANPGDRVIKMPATDPKQNLKILLQHE